MAPGIGNDRTQPPPPNAPASATVWDPEHRVLTTGLLLTVSTAAVESLAVATTMPATVATIGGLEYYGWTFAGFMLAEVVGISAAGRLADTRGLAGPFSVGAALFVLGLLAAGFAASMPQLVAGRVVQGLGAGAISALAYAAVARGYSTEAKPRMLALLSTAWVAPGLIGPAIAGSVADRIGWRWVFLGVAPLMVPAGLMVIPALRRFGRPEADAAAASAVLPAIALALGGGLVMTAPHVSAPLATLAVLLGAAVATPALRRLLPPGTLALRPGLPAAIAVMALLSASFFGAEVFVPLALTDVRGQSSALAGLVLTASTLTWTAGAWLQERLASRHTRRSTAAAGMALLALGIVLTGAVLAADIPAWITVPVWGIAGLGIGLAYTTIALVMLEQAPQGGEGAASAALQLANVLGIAAGTGASGALMAMLAGDGESTSLALLLVGALAFVLAVLGLAATGRLRERGSDSV